MPKQRYHQGEPCFKKCLHMFRYSLLCLSCGTRTSDYWFMAPCILPSMINGPDIWPSNPTALVLHTYLQYATKTAFLILYEIYMYCKLIFMYELSHKCIIDELSFNTKKWCRLKFSMKSLRMCCCLSSYIWANVRFVWEDKWRMILNGWMQFQTYGAVSLWGCSM